LIDQVEFADVLLVNKVDLISDPERERLLAALAALNPRARLLTSVRGEVDLRELLFTGRFDLGAAQEAPGWMAVLRGEERPETDEYGIRSFVFRDRRPFHPERFVAFLHKPKPGLLRSKGHFWLATRPAHVGYWNQAGRQVEVGPMGQWWAAVPKSQWPRAKAERAQILSDFAEPYGDRRQELVFIGQDLDEAEIRADLVACLVSAEEERGGIAAMAGLPDPLDVWHLETEGGAR
jgi:G3E family GTPase